MNKESFGHFNALKLIRRSVAAVSVASLVAWRLRAGGDRRSNYVPGGWTVINFEDVSPQ